MKVRFYLDVYKGWTPEHACAWAVPTYDTSAGSTRVHFDVEIPDHLIRYDEGQYVGGVRAVPEEA